MFDTCNWLSELRGWQTGIGSVLGFVALTWGALFNFNLNRKRDEYLREQEMLSVATALYGEILMFRADVAGIARVVAHREIHGPKLSAEFLAERALEEPVLYPALASKIGLLSSNLVLAVTEFHKNLHEVKRGMPLLVQDNARAYGYGPSWVLRPAVDAVKKVVPFLREVERLARLPPAKEEDLGFTEAVLEHEDDVHSTP